jgi:hypothetical protein
MDLNINKKATDEGSESLNLGYLEAVDSDDDFTINECGDTQWDAVLEEEERRLEVLKCHSERS